MTLMSSSLPISKTPPISTLSKLTFNPKPLFSLPFHSKTKILSHSFKTRAKPRELILGNPSVTVEKGKYSYDVETLINKLSSLPPRGLLDKCSEIFEEMPAHGVGRSVFSYTSLINAYGRNGVVWIGRGCWDCFSKNAHDGIQPDLITYNTLLSACANRGLGDEAEMVFRKAYARSGSMKEAIGVFRQMQAAGCVPNATTYSILLNLYGRHGKYDDVHELFLEMKEVVTLFHDMVEENIEPNMETSEGLIFACGKGGLHEDAKQILSHMNEKGVVPSSKAFTGVVEALGQSALYEEALVAFNTMNEVGSKPTLETYNSLIHMFARNTYSFNGMIEAFGQGGQFEAAFKAYVDMEKSRCEPDERTLEAVLSIYCSAGLLEESKEQFREIKASGIVPSIICYCLLLSVIAKSERVKKESSFLEEEKEEELWDEANELLEEMITNRVSNAHQVIGHMIKGDYDDDINWQMVEYVFDKFNSEGCGLGLRFYNALLEALWWLGQKARSAKVLREATVRGLFPELFRKSKLVWSVDVHRMSVGGALTATSVWLNNVHDMFTNREDLPHLAAVVVVRGEMERSSITREFPVAKAVYSFLKDSVSSYFCYPGWNRGRIICHRPQLKRILTGHGRSSDGPAMEKLVTINNSPFPRPGIRASTTTVNVDQHVNEDSEAGILTSKLMTITV
ncbi:hypothetical protein IFM89_000719 [Coptis chinensis]|uniref:Smr domain-containing protein n=1 Tax=Coptis chinensis TaxID=261450 RepID=A0A835M8I3_9MAGN|nr:hypothetical protein IFM89_000719 [Coptis chinensis]